MIFHNTLLLLVRFMTDIILKQSLNDISSRINNKYNNRYQVTINYSPFDSFISLIYFVLINKKVVTDELEYKQCTVYDYDDVKNVMFDYLLFDVMRCGDNTRYNLLPGLNKHEKHTYVFNMKADYERCFALIDPFLYHITPEIILSSIDIWKDNSNLTFQPSDDEDKIHHFDFVFFQNKYYIVDIE